MQFAPIPRSAKYFSVMLFHDICHLFLRFVIKEMQSRRHSDIGVGISQKYASQDRSPHSTDTCRGAKRPSSKSLQLEGPMKSGCHTVPKTFFRQAWNLLFLATFLCHQYIEITLISPALLSFYLYQYLKKILL